MANLKNTEALLNATGEFAFAPDATSVATAEDNGYLDFGNIVAVGFRSNLETLAHEGSYEGVKREDKTIPTKAVQEYTIKCDEWDVEKLKIALFGKDATDFTQSAITNAAIDALGFTANPAVKNRWYDLRTGSVRIREITAIHVPAAAAASVTADAGTDEITLNAHGLSAGATVVLGGTAAPGGTTAGTIYYVISPTANTFKISATKGGTAVDLTSAGTSVTAEKGLLEDTDYVLDKKAGRIRFAAAQSADKTPRLSASAVTAGGAAAFQAMTPLNTYIRKGWGRLLLYDDTHPNKLYFDHHDFGCEVYLENADELDGKKFAEMSLRVKVTDPVGTIFIAE